MGWFHERKQGKKRMVPTLERLKYPGVKFGGNWWVKSVLLVIFYAHSTRKSENKKGLQVTEILVNPYQFYGGGIRI